MDGKATNIFDSITMGSSVLGVYFSLTNIQAFLTLICTGVCLVSGLITLVLRVISLFKKNTSADSAGGKALTPDEIKEIADEIETGVAKIDTQVNKDGK